MLKHLTAAIALAASTGMVQAEARLDPWRSIFIKIMDDAPWVPIFNEQRFTMHSARIAGPTDNIFVDPAHIPVHYDQVFATDVQ